jgi:hypothetical protein
MVGLAHRHGRPFVFHSTFEKYIPPTAPFWVSSILRGVLSFLATSILLSSPVT